MDRPLSDFIEASIREAVVQLGAETATTDQIIARSSEIMLNAIRRLPGLDYTVATIIQSERLRINAEAAEADQQLPRGRGISALNNLPLHTANTNSGSSTIEHSLPKVMRMSTDAQLGALDRNHNQVPDIPNPPVQRPMADAIAREGIAIVGWTLGEALLVGVVVGGTTSFYLASITGVPAPILVPVGVVSAIIGYLAQL